MDIVSLSLIDLSIYYWQRHCSMMAGAFVLSIKDASCPQRNKSVQGYCFWISGHSQGRSVIFEPGSLASVPDSEDMRKAVTSGVLLEDGSRTDGSAPVMVVSDFHCKKCLKYSFGLQA